MSKELQVLTDQRANLEKELADFQEGLPKGKERASDEDVTKFNDFKTKLSDVDEKIEKEQARLKMEEEIAEANARRLKLDKKHAQEKNGPPEMQLSNSFSLARAISQFDQKRSLNGAEAEMTQEAQKDQQRAGVAGGGNISLPHWAVRIMGDKQFEGYARALSVGVAADGGDTVPTDLNSLIPVLRPRLKLIEMGSQVIPGLVGNQEWPRQTLAGSASMNTETGAGNETTPQFDKIALAPNRIEAYTVMSKQLLAQSPSISEQFVRRDLELAIATQLDTQGLNGDGTGNNLLGLANISGIGAANWNGADPYEVIVDLETAITEDNADVSSMGYLTTPGVKGLFKKSRIDAGSGMMVWPVGARELNGYRAEVSTQVPISTTHYMYFGNWAEVIIGQWAGIDIVVDPYSLSRNAQLQIVINGWYDIDIRHVESIALATDIAV